MAAPVAANRGSELTEDERGGLSAPVVPLRAIPVSPPAHGPLERRRVGRGGSRPPTRRPLPGAPHVLETRHCARRRPIPAVLLLGLAAVVAAAVYGLGLFAGAMSGPDVPPTTTVVRVGPGESLSELAQRMAPGHDPEAVVAKIRELNRLPGGAVRNGQPLTVPFER
ncbi:hypothetical protein ACOBQX_25175 [Actinokineospora sp. G85]|uniref:hypothetical protein n=1 Tax=Actinokineospora sp. G85 TaxID=3406626 RepID=UPI003C7510DF